MNNAHRMSKRKRQAILFFTYGFMTLATIAISTVCILLIMGYRFDVTDRTIEQGALLQFRSTPSDAKITINDKLQSYTTPGKLDVAVGTYRVKMEKANYHEWNKTVTVKAGELRWLNYARLVPTTIQNTTAARFTGTITNALATPDRRFLATIGDAAQPVVQITDLRNENNITSRSLTIPTEQLTLTPNQPSQFTIKEWDFGSRFLLILHKSGDVTEYIRLDRSNDTGAARNITKEFNLPFHDMHFSGTSGNALYALTGKDLRKVDTGNGSVSQPLVNDVESYRLYRENDVAFVALRGDKHVAGVFLDNKETIVRSVAATQPVLVDLTKYYSNYYFAVTTPEGVDIIKDPVETSEAARRNHAQLAKGNHDVNWLDFASSGRFVLIGTADAYSLYDLETDEHYAVAKQLGSEPAKQPVWLDDFYIVTTVTGQARIFEYDGQNEQAIVKSVPTLPAFLSDNGDFLYSFTENGGNMTLQSSRMILE